MTVHESILQEDGSRPFDAVAIESDLRSMWKRSAEPGTIYRAAQANLVVPLDPPLGPKLAPVLVEVTRRHPSRLFSIGAGAAAPGSRLRARIGAICHRREGGGGLVCSEQVVLDSDPESASLIPSAIRALRIGDLPTVLLHFHPRLDLPWIGELMKMADLILLDSCLLEPGREAEAWRFLGREGSRRVHDLTWARLLPWRTVLAESFDEAELRPALETVRAVEITYTGAVPSPPPPAWLLAGWLASRLGWRMEGGGGSGLRLRSGSGPVTIAMKSTGQGDARVVERVRIRSEAPHALDLEVAHRGRDRVAHVLLRAPLERECDTPFGYREFATCIVAEIHRHADNRPMEEAAGAAEAMMKHWKAA